MKPAQPAARNTASVFPAKQVITLMELPDIIRLDFNPDCIQSFLIAELFTDYCPGKHQVTLIMLGNVFKAAIFEKIMNFAEIGISNNLSDSGLVNSNPFCYVFWRPAGPSTLD